MPLSTLLARAAMLTARRAGMSSGGRAALGAYGYAIGASIDAITAPISAVATREAGYRIEAAATNNIPGPSQLIHAYWTGHLSRGELSEYLGYHGIWWIGNGVGGLEGNKKTWQSVIKSMRPRLDPSTVVDLWQQHAIEENECKTRLSDAAFDHPATQSLLMRSRGWFDLSTATDLWHQGVLPPDEYVKAIWRSGIGDGAAVAHLLTQTTTLPLSDWEQHWLSGWVGDDEYTARLRREGYSDPVQLARKLRERTPVSLGQTTTDYWLGIVQRPETVRRMELLGYGTEAEQTTVLGAQAAFPPAVALGLMFRGEMPPADLPKHLSAAGLVSPASQNQWIAGQRPLPSPGQLVEWGSRDLWNGAAVEALGLDAEFPPALSWWMQRQGWAELPATGFAGGANAPAVDPWDMVWRAHWRMPSLSQVVQASRIIRPDNLAQWRQIVPTMTVPPQAAIDAIHKAEGYSPPVRNWLVALTFKRLRPTQAVRLYALDKRPRAWLIGQLLDYGYTAEAAGDYADMVDAQIADKEEAIARKERAKARADLVKELERGFSLGTLTRAFVLDRLAALEYDPRAAESALEAIVARENLKVVEESIKRLRKAYLDGEFAPAELAQRLSSVGVLPEVTQRYLALWTLQRTQSRRMFTTSKLQSLVAEGKMLPAVALVRLVNLGWSNPDALLMLAESAARADALAKRQAHAESLAAGKRQREMENVRKDALKLVKDSERHLSHLTPVSMLKRLVCEAIVSPGWAGDRMLAMGYDPDTVTLYLEDWASQNSANKKCLPPKDDTTSTASQPASPAPAAPPSGLMTLAGQPIPETGSAQTTTVQPTGKQGP